jgi:hypothetical protein
MSNIMNRGNFFQLPSKTDFTGWTNGEKPLYTTLYKKAHDTSRSVLTLSTRDIMSLAGIKSRTTSSMLNFGSVALFVVYRPTASRDSMSSRQIRNTAPESFQ